MLAYRIELVPDDNGTFLVTCPDIPMVATFGETEQDAAHHAVDAIETALASMIDDGGDIPIPTAGPGRMIRLPMLTTIKVLLYGAIRQDGITRAELARRLGWHREQVDRLFRLDHNTRFDQFDAAFSVLNRDLEIEMRAAA